MKLLPVAERELRIASRRRGTYWLRFGAAGLAILVAGVILMAMLRERTTEQSQVLFVALSILAFLFCLASGVLTTSDCVSEEKRDGTLGLLFLTDLRGYDVVLGKLAASSARSIAALVSILPVIAVPLLMGGVAAEAVWSIALHLVNTLFLSLALGILVSVLARDARHAVGGTVLALLGLLAMIPLARWLAVEYLLDSPIDAVPPVGGLAPPGVRLPQPLGWLLLANPVMPMVSSFQVLVGGGPLGPVFWQAIAVQHALAWSALIGACLVLPRIWQDTAERAVTSEENGGVTATARLAARGEWLDREPFAWMVVREPRATLVLWIGLGLIGVVWIWGFAEVQDDWLHALVGMATVSFAGLWLKVQMAAKACRHLHEHRRTGALELLLSTPLGPASVVRGNLAGLKHLHLPAIAVVFAVGWLLLIAGLRQDASGSDSAEWVMTYIAALVMGILDLWTMAWAGMWFGLRSRRYVRAFAKTLAWVLVAPWALFVLSAVFVGILVDGLRVLPGFDPEYHLVLGWWVLIGLAVDAWLLLTARLRLAAEMREFVAVGPEGRPASRIAPSLAPSGATPSMTPS